MEKKNIFRKDEIRGNSVVSASCSPVLKSYTKAKKLENWVKKSKDLGKVPKILMISSGVNQPVIKTDRELVEEAIKKFQFSNKSSSYLSKSPYNATPDKLPKVKKRRISEFHQKFEEKWLECQELTGNEHFLALISLLDSIIQEDFLFGSYLLRIKSSILNWKKTKESESMKNRLNFENIIPKLCSNSKKLLNRKPKILKSEEIKQSKHDSPNLSNLNIRSESNMAVSATKCFSQLIMPTNSEQIPNNRLEILVQESETLKSKIIKYEQLINALQNRGYPLDSIYINDVLMQVPSVSLENTLVSSPLIDPTILSSDDSLN